MKIELVSFDYFDTLVKQNNSSRWVLLEPVQDFLSVKLGSQYSIETLVQVWQNVYERNHAESLVSLDEFPFSKICIQVLEELKMPTDDEILEHVKRLYLEQWLRNVEPVREINDLLSRLKTTYKIIIISNTHHAPLVHDSAVNFEIHKSVEKIYTSIEHGKRKPDPSIFLDALQEHKVKPENAIHIGDNLFDDIQGARRAGLQHIHACIQPARKEVHHTLDCEKLIKIHNTEYR